MKSVAMSKVLSSVILASAIAGSSSAQAPDPPSSGTNRVQLGTGVIFNTFGDGSEHMRKMRERLQDPQQRAALREENRGHIVVSHYDVAEVLGLDAATHDKLIDLLTDQQMAQLEEFHLRGFSETPPDVTNHLQLHADRQNREIDALRELLGQEKLERFQVYRSTLGQRWQLREFEAYLAPTDKLNSKQKEQLIELFRAHFQRSLQDHHGMRRGRSGLDVMMRDMPSREELQRRSQLMTIEANEASWRRMPESDRRLREQAAAFLTASQLASLEQLHADKLQQLQRSIEQMRVQAGLNPTIPPAIEGDEPTPAKVTRDVRLRIKIAVNHAKPVTFTEVVSSGTPYTFEIDEGLLVQATPIVYDNETYDLRVEYFEQGATGKRSIGNMGGMGTLNRVQPGNEALALMGGSSTVISGSKAYAIELSTSVEGT
jgi:hypothetical protein